ncbi:FAD-binding oxidoreductase [Actibacterium pelagium]|uniref:D-2-hydroxyacid dehydrogenase n=1 Tax=Actibacterium pelagium TaxID=2029103 RepID=A0A917AIA0_9RHOB|nr:FAD-binding oxidoreductase [Actibacterium pelagium]GGE50586.1 D-2-hydroxyacid dehydrogenase [Actibacterium pelagium]
MLNPADDTFLNTLKEKLPEHLFRPLAPSYLEEPRGRYVGQAGAIIAPENTDQVAEVVRLCNEARVGIVPYAGGTGLVGGQLQPDGPAPVLLSLERMTAVRDVFPTENVLVVEAGAILTDVQAAAEEVDRLFPLSLASEGSARIGGLLSTNAGGVNVLRYGNARELCLGIEAVLPNGEIMNTLTRLRKDNTGYDLRDLLIGAEGTLGIITAAALKLHPRPAGEGTALLTVKDPTAALALLALTGKHMAGGVSAFELMHRRAFEFFEETDIPITCPFDETPEWVVLLEIGLPKGIDPQSALEALFEDALEAGLVDDGIVAQSEAQRLAFWAMREEIPTANRRIGSISSHDISVPISSIPDFIEEGGKRLAALGPIRVNCFGHLGDGNLHYNVFPPEGRDRAEFDGIRDQVKRIVHDLVHEMSGSCSAEHGIGRLKVGDLERYGDPAKLNMMRAIKTAVDPHGIMNPGAVLRAD